MKYTSDISAHHSRSVPLNTLPGRGRGRIVSDAIAEVSAAAHEWIVELVDPGASAASREEEAESESPRRLELDADPSAAFFACGCVHFSSIKYTSDISAHHSRSVPLNTLLI